MDPAVGVHNAGYKDNNSDIIHFWWNQTWKTTGNELKKFSDNIIWINSSLAYIQTFLSIANIWRLNNLNKMN